MPIAALETALYNKLAAGTALISELGGTAIYNTRAPQSPPAKYVVFQWQGGGDDNDHPRRSRSPVYTVVGVAATKAAAGAIDVQIDALLHGGTLTVTGYNHFWLARESDVSFAEDDSAGVVRWRVGGQYRIRIEKS